MDKNGKLQRYERKDYAELVDFPVEIVGRDGVVRRYTFEDSVRLYQRRITFAPIRYRDPDLVGAEVVHCRSRIEQLRHSYFVHYGWGTGEGEPPGEELFGILAGEITAFLRRVLACPRRLELGFERASPPSNDSKWRIRSQLRDGLVLYVFEFKPGSDESRGRFFSLLKNLERTGRSDDAGERLLAFHHMVDCGIVLTGHGGPATEAFVAREGTVELPPTPWDEAVEALRQGELEQGLQRCKQIVAEQPWDRRAYVAGSLTAACLGDVPAAEELALLGLCYFADDRELLRNLAVARLRDGRAAEAVGDLRRVFKEAPDDVSAGVALIAALQRLGQYAELDVVLRTLGRVPPDDRRGAEQVECFARWWKRQRRVRWLGWALGLGGALGIAYTGAGAIAVGGTGGLVLLILRFAERRQVDRMVARVRHDEVSVGLRRISRRSAEALIT